VDGTITERLQPLQKQFPRIDAETVELRHHAQQSDELHRHHERLERRATARVYSLRRRTDANPSES